MKLTHEQQNPVSNPKKWLQLLSWTLSFTLLFLKSLFLFLIGTWLSWFPFSSQFLSLCSSLQSWWVILAFMLFTFGPPSKMGDVYLLARSTSGCSEVLTLVNQVLIPGPFRGFDLSQWHPHWAWLPQMGAGQEARWSKETVGIPGST